MRIISIFTTLALTSSLCAQQPIKAAKLADSPLYKEGISALKDYVPNIAIKKFSTLLEVSSKDTTLSDKDKQSLLFLLAESQIRATIPDDALITLTSPLIANHPDTFFWKGQALAKAGRYNEAIEALEQTSAGSKYHTLAQLKIAYLSASLNDTDKALSILSQSVKKQNRKDIHPQTYLSLANLYLTKNDPKNAALTLEKITTTNDVITQVKQVLQAQTDILQKSYPKAIQTLTSIVKSPASLDRKTLGYATLYLADALHLNGQNQESIRTLISYLDQYPSSQQLGSIFSRLNQWIPKETAITDPVIKKLTTWAGRNQQENTNNINETNEETADLRTFSHYYYARFLSQQTEPSSKVKAIFELNLLRIRQPTHILAGTSLTDTATTQLALGRVGPAKDTLKLIQRLNTPITPIAKQQAAFLLGKLNFNEKNYTEAASAFQTVVDSATTRLELRKASIINAATAYLAAANVEGFFKLQEHIDNPLIQKNLILEHALWLAHQNHQDARSTLHDFTLRSQKHPRIDEARLALGLNCLQASPIDPDLCKSIISDIRKENLRKEQYAEYAYLLYRNATAHKDYARAASAARQFTETDPDHPRAIEFTLLQGQALYHNGQHNDARRILLNLVKNHPLHPLKNYAEYYAAMSAKREDTPQSQKEAIALFSKISAKKSNLTKEALLQLAQLYIKKNEPQLAIDKLKPAFAAETIGNKSHHIGVILASAYHALAGDQPQSKNFQQALEIYDTLISQSKEDPKVLNQLKYHKALTLQHMNRDDQALEIYYSVINRDLDRTPITEWLWYYECGFKAIAMLEDMKNPNGAIAIAKKLSASNGPRAKEAANRARRLEMKYMIWER